MQTMGCTPQWAIYSGFCRTSEIPIFVKAFLGRNCQSSQAVRELTWTELVCQILGHWVSNFGSSQGFDSLLFLVGKSEHVWKWYVIGTWRTTYSIVPRAMANLTQSFRG